VFITLKTEGDIKDRARALAANVGIGTTVLSAVFLAWTLIAHFSLIGLVLAALAALSLIAALFANHLKREGISFSLLVFTIVTAVGALFATLFPNVFPSTTNPAYSLTIQNASSSEYTLTVMSWVAIVMIPLVLLYQGWTYWVFRKRVSRKSIPAGSH
jgi:cytochrome d ubiquinol oxidase subunit II